MPVCKYPNRCAACIQCDLHARYLSAQHLHRTVHSGASATQPASQRRLRSRGAFAFDVFENHALNRGEADRQLLRHALFTDHFASQDLNLTRSTSEVAGSAVDGQNRHSLSCLKHVKMMTKRSVRRVHHGLKFPIAKAGSLFQGAKNSMSKGVFVAGGSGGYTSKRHGAHGTCNARKSTCKTGNTSCSTGQSGCQPWALASPLGEKWHEVGLPFSSLKSSAFRASGVGWDILGARGCCQADLTDPATIFRCATNGESNRPQVRP